MTILPLLIVLEVLKRLVEVVRYVDLPSRTPEYRYVGDDLVVASDELNAAQDIILVAGDDQDFFPTKDSVEQFL
jgi:hypothetical protein